MIQRISDNFSNHPPKEVELFLRLFHVLLTGETYRDLVTSALSNSYNFTERKTLLEMRMFTKTDLCTLLSGVDPGKAGVGIVVVSSLLKRLIDWGLVIDNDFELENQRVRYQWSTPMIGLFANLGILDNVLLGKQHIVKKYTPCVPAIVVVKEGCERVGTGFLVYDHYRGVPFSGRAVKCDHNVLYRQEELSPDLE